MRVLVTGYGGFLGAAVCRQLLEAGHEVTGFARQRYERLEKNGVRVVRGDIRDRDQVVSASVGMEAVIHTAAKAGVWGSWSEYHGTNTLATSHVLDACRQHRIRYLVHCSSPSVTFAGQPQSNIDESVPYPTKWLCHYPHSKALAEQQVLGANSPENGLLTVALRPHLIWGQGDPHLIPRVIERCIQGRLICIGSGKNLIDTVHVETAAAAHVAALKTLSSDSPKCAGKAYFITDGQPISCWDWISQLLKGADLPIPTRRIPLRLAYLLGGMLETLYKATGKTAEPPMTRFVALQLGLDHYFNIAAARRDLGFNPSCNRQQTLAEMKPWLLQLADACSPK